MKHRSLYLLFAIGALIVGWIAVGFAGTSPLALLVTLVIAVVYAVGALELRRFSAETDGLASALDDVAGHADAPAWLATVPAGLRPAIKQSLESGRAALPQPGLTPYLVGLLVMIGLIGTFVGLVSTLQGAVVAIENSRELDAIRAGLAAPVRGLGMAFGTSVAGVAASAALGMIATLCRYQRVRVGQRLSDALTSELRPWTVYQRQQRNDDALQSLLNQQIAFQQQSHEAFRDLAEQLSTTLREQALETGRQLSEHARNTGSQLGDAVVPMLERSLAGFGETAARSLEAYGNTARDTQQALSEVVEKQQAAVSQQLEQHAASVLGAIGEEARAREQRGEAADARRAEQWQQVLEQSSGQIQSMLDSGAAQWQGLLDKSAGQWQALLENSAGQWQSLVDKGSAQQGQILSDSLGQWNDSTRQLTDGLHAQIATVLTDWRESTAALRTSLENTAETVSINFNGLEASFDKAVKDRAALEEALTARLAAIQQQLQKSADDARTLAEADFRQWQDAARENAERVSSQLEQIAAQGAERDSRQQQEAAAQLDSIHAMTSQLQAASSAQLEAINTLVSRSGETLETIAARFAEVVGERSAELEATVTGLEAGGSDVAALAESFAVAVERFDASGQELHELFARLETVIEASAVRSGDQMEYYLAQAREIIDHNLITQQDILTHWKELVRADDLPETVPADIALTPPPHEPPELPESQEEPEPQEALEQQDEPGPELQSESDQAPAEDGPEQAADVDADVDAEAEIDSTVSAGA